MPKLNSAGYKLLERFIGVVLDRHVAGTTDRSRAIGQIAHIVAAIDRDDGDNPQRYMDAVISDPEA
jgi:hypothetical protein